jgi:predicted Zn-ribbon and HTH transcriptional regulator
VSRPALEVADIFRDHGPAWRRANAGHVSLEQLKVMSAIENCRTAALGGHVARCEDCAYTTIAYNSCRNRHCPKCQGAAAKEWLADREADLLPVPYYHVVFTLPAPIAEIAYQNKAVVYDLLFKVSAETMLTISTCCQKACTASATTACSPKARAPTTSPAPVSCSPFQTPRTSSPLPPSITASPLVHAAAVA